MRNPVRIAFSRTHFESPPRLSNDNSKHQFHTRVEWPQINDKACITIGGNKLRRPRFKKPQLTGVEGDACWSNLYLHFAACGKQLSSNHTILMGTCNRYA
ncbi:hypothetical protein RmaAA213_10600 [Rhodothermus marinus]|nr:hypothetical protein RmaAA213_10600 [Rhodothermus marinus]BBM72206.1 hypothetical protein RmaAA338_10710 [Rhodothermus marinus]